ncbi:unnamed protein product [Camellia sinensis]
MRLFPTPLLLPTRPHLDHHLPPHLALHLHSPPPPPHLNLPVRPPFLLLPLLPSPPPHHHRRRIFSAAGPNFRRRHPLQEEAHINQSPRDRDLDRVVPVLPFQNRPLGHQRRHPHDRMPPRQRRSLCRTGGGDKSELGSDRPGRPEGGEPLKPEGRIGGAPLADRRGSGTVRFDPRRREPEGTHVGVGAVRDSGDVRWWIGGGGWDDAIEGGEFAGGGHGWNAVDGEG